MCDLIISVPDHCLSFYCLCSAVTIDEVSFLSDPEDPEEEPFSDICKEQEVSEDALLGMALTSQDWHKAQSSDGNLY